MPRPKGSKNKKRTVQGVGLDEQIFEIVTKIDDLGKEDSELATLIEESKAKRKEIQKQIRLLQKQSQKLKIKKETMEAAAIAAERKQAVETRIEELFASGKTTEDILDLLK